MYVLGTPFHATMVFSWTSYRIPHSEVNETEHFGISVNKSTIQSYDQGSGLEYAFRVHAFNRAGLFASTVSPVFQVNSKQLPSTGTTFHVGILSPLEQIGFQSRLDVLCVRWFGFSHHSEDISFLVAIGSAPYSFDIRSYENSTLKNHHCVSGLRLMPYTKYYATVKAVSIEGYSLATTHGVFVGNESEILKHSRIYLGYGCPPRFDSIVYEKPHNASILVKTTEFDIFIPKTSFPERTLRISFENVSLDDVNEFPVQINNISYQISAWLFTSAGIQTFYTFVHLDDQVLVSIDFFPPLLLDNIVEIAIHECKEVTYPASNINTPIRLAFNPLGIDFMTHFEVALSSDYANDSTFVPIGTSTNFYSPFEQENDMPYILHVRPCFSMTCLTPIASATFIVDDRPPLSKYIHASFSEYENSQYPANQVILSARWDPFIFADNVSQSKTYDYGISKYIDGSQMIIPWSRQHWKENQSLYEVFFNHVYYF